MSDDRPVTEAIAAAVHQFRTALDVDNLVRAARYLDANPPLVTDPVTGDRNCTTCGAKDVYDPVDHLPTCAYRIVFHWVTDHPETT